MFAVAIATDGLWAPLSAGYPPAASMTAVSWANLRHPTLGIDVAPLRELANILMLAIIVAA